VIRQKLQEKAEELGGQVREDRELLDEVCGLNEFPMVIAGSFRLEFLALPEEVLTTVMRKHQKYFSLEDSQGRLMPWFLAVTDSPADLQGMIRRGHERVLEARLNDASFFWKVDTEKSLKDRLPMLERCLFHLKLGSYLEKTARIESIALDISTHVAELEIATALIPQAARLMKADLATDMVKELTELQGVMGGIYARQEGLPETIWQAIYDQYLPRHLEDASPRNKVGALLSLADRMDTLAGCFGVGIIPKGSSDPFALRRQAQGVIKILWDHDLPLTIAQLTDSALAAVEEKISRPTEDIRSDIAQFFEQRIRYMLQQRGYTYDVINASLAGGFEPPTETLLRTDALQRIRSQPDFLDIAVAFKRVKNILKDIDLGKLPEPEPALFQEEAERTLAAALAAAFPAVKSEMDQKNYYQALKGMAQLRPAVHGFFEKVLVMAPEISLKKNRLALLRELSALFLLVGDISEIVMEGEPGNP
jgi:glycyl-tRNA synthetase beta chain